MTMRMTAVDGYDWFQRKFKGIEVGDVFSVPLSLAGFGFGRVINAHDGATLAEFFRYWSETADYEPEIISSGRLFSPTGFLITDIEHGNRKRPWKVVHKDPKFYPEDLYDLKFSQSHDGEIWTYYTLRDENQTLGKISRRDVDEFRVPSILPQHRDRITKVVEGQLRAEGIIPS